MHNLKDRLEPIKLTEAQRERILRRAKSEYAKEGAFNTQTRRRKGPIIVSVIVCCAMLFIAYSLLLEPESLWSAGGGQAAEREGAAPLTMKIVMWNLLATVLVIIALMGARKAVLHVKRWQGKQVVERLKPIFESKPKLILLHVTLLLLLWGGSYLLDWSFLFTQIWIVLCQIVAMFMFESYHLRDYSWCSCPHCGTPFTRKQIRKKSTWNYREQCDACEKPIFLASASKKKYSPMLSIYPSFLVYFSVFNFNLILALLFVVAFIWIVTRHITPYAIQFSAEPPEEKDEKLW